METNVNLCNEKTILLIAGRSGIPVVKTKKGSAFISKDLSLFKTLIVRK